MPNKDSPLKDAEFDKVVEVLTVDQFKEWLAKYNLKSS